MYSMLLGTKVYGYQKRALSDPLVPAQLWVVAHGSGGVYTFENANSRTLMDLTGSMRRIPVRNISVLTRLELQATSPTALPLSGTRRRVNRTRTGLSFAPPRSPMPMCKTSIPPAI